MPVMNQPKQVNQSPWVERSPTVFSKACMLKEFKLQLELKTSTIDLHEFNVRISVMRV